MRRHKFGSCLVLLAAFWFAGNSGLLVVVPPCPMHGTLAIGGAGMPMGHSDAAHGKAPTGGSQHSQHSNGCNCGGRCGTVSPQFAVSHSHGIPEAIVSAERASPSFVQRAHDARLIHLPFPTGPPTLVAA